MLSYKIPATVTLLKSKLEVAQTSLDNTIEDLDSEFLMEQLTVMEVNTARVTDGMRNGEGSCERQENISFPPLSLPVCILPALASVIFLTFDLRHTSYLFHNYIREMNSSQLCPIIYIIRPDQEKKTSGEELQQSTPISFSSHCGFVPRHASWIILSACRTLTISDIDGYQVNCIMIYVTANLVHPVCSHWLL